MFLIGVIISGPVMIAMIAIDLSLVFANQMAQQNRDQMTLATILKNHMRVRRSFHYTLYFYRNT